MIVALLAAILAILGPIPSADLEPAVRGPVVVELEPEAPAIIPGDCESVRAVFDYYDPTGHSSAFFIDRGIAYRETRCGLDTINERSGDTGVVQLNPVHNTTGYFGGTNFTNEGGWLFELHGLRTRQDSLNSEWANAAISLRQVCGDGPWTVGNYTCLYRTLDRQL